MVTNTKPRRGRPPKQHSQASFDEEQIADPHLEASLEDWHEAREQRAPLQATYMARSKIAKGLIEGKELEPGTYRVGRFIVTIAESESRDVAFTLNSRTRIGMRLAKT